MLLFKAELFLSKKKKTTAHRAYIKFPRKIDDHQVHNLVSPSTKIPKGGNNLNAI